jgi:predicted acetyltransferase
MDFRMRPIEPDEHMDFSRAASLAFGSHLDEAEAEHFRDLFEFDRTLAVFDGDAIVGTAGAISFQLTVPGPATIPAAGVTIVTVLPTHRRRGILTALMRRQLDDIRQRGEPLAILYASESIIYGRFGYGAATLHIGFEIDRQQAVFSRPVLAPGKVRLLDKETALEVLPDVYDRVRLSQPGFVNRSPEWWQAHMRDPERWRSGASARFYAVYESATGEPEGYASYRIKGNWEHGVPRGTLTLTELVTGTPESHAGLWQYCLGVDLMGSVKTYALPVDEPLRWMLADQRSCRVVDLVDGIWVRLLDIPAALKGRRYQREGSLVIQVEDAFCPNNAGAYALEAGPQGADCKPTKKAPDLRMGVNDLGSTYLGGVSFTTLARAGRVKELREGALHQADVMFASEPAPWCVHDF